MGIKEVASLCVGTVLLVGAIPTAAQSPGASASGAWSGPYGGLHLGYGAGRDNVTEVNGPRAYFPDTSGTLGGAQIGWQRQFDRVVAGLELELGSLGQSGSVTKADEVSAVSNRADLGFYGLLSGRAGYLVTPSWLIFGRAGLAMADLNAKTTMECGPAASCLEGSGEAKTKGVTIGYGLGAGIEHALSTRWSARAEYQYMSFRRELALPPVSGPGWRHDLDLHLIKIGVNYHF